MSLKAIYPWTSTMTVIGVLAVGIGIPSGSLLIIAEGLVLVWLAMKLTFQSATLEQIA